MTGLEALRQKAGKLPEGRCLIGFSGGADSTALIRLAAMAREDGETLPEAVHVNHGIRGEDADRDEAFCREVCRELRIPFHTVRVRLDGRKDENACREARFRAFEDRMEETGVRTLVLAHNRDDLAETFLMRLMRGSGLEGLDCMSENDQRNGYTIRRPLLGTGRTEIREALRQDGYGWREDKTNQSPNYLRNEVRMRLIPLMAEMAPGAAERIARTAAILSEENRMLQEEAETFLGIHSGENRIETGALAQLPEPMQKRVLRAWWKENGPKREERGLSAAQTEALAALIRKERGKVNLPGETYAERSRGYIHLTGIRRETPEETAYQSGEIRFGQYAMTTGPSEGNPGDGKRAQEVPEEFTEGCVLRTRRPGDRIRPFGMDGSRKLQDYLTDRKIEEIWRDEIPLLCRGNEVLLVAGVGAGGVPAWNAGNRNIRLQWRGELPWACGESEEENNGERL